MIVLLVLAIIILAWLGRSGFLVGRAVKANRFAKATLKPFNRHVKNARYHLLVLGDSTMFGAGVTNRADTMGGQLAQLFPTADVETVAKNGTRIAGLSQQLSSAAQPFYDLAVIGAGGNDIVFMSDYAQVEQDLRDFLNRLGQRSRHVILTHCVNIGNTGFFVPPLNLLFDRRTRKLSQLYAKITRDYSAVHYVNFYRPRRNDHYARHTRAPFIAADKFHPSDHANRYFFELMRREVGLDEAFLKDRVSPKVTPSSAMLK